MGDESSITRRGLFRGLGTAAVVTGCAVDRPELEKPETEPTRTDPPRATTLSFRLDGKDVEAQVEARTTLAALLRIDLNQTGTKIVCDRGACGACMVMVDGVPKNSCMLLAHDVEGAEVTTIAGLASGEKLSALQAAFIKHDALQCGYCTSGMVISCEALLRRRGNETLDADAVKEAIAGNLCRCGTYPHVIAAVLEVAGTKGGGAG